MSNHSYGDDDEYDEWGGTKAEDNCKTDSPESGDKFQSSANQKLTGICREVSHNGGPDAFHQVIREGNAEVFVDADIHSPHVCCNQSHVQPGIGVRARAAAPAENP